MEEIDISNLQGIGSTIALGALLEEASNPGDSVLENLKQCYLELTEDLGKQILIVRISEAPQNGQGYSLIFRKDKIEFKKKSDTLSMDVSLDLDSGLIKKDGEPSQFEIDYFLGILKRVIQDVKTKKSVAFFLKIPEQG
jgi:hypothetical protein